MGFQQNLLKWVFCYFIGDISVGYLEKGGGGDDSCWVVSGTFTNGVKL